jgi:hypothetical protein
LNYEEFIELNDLVDPHVCGYPLSDPQVVGAILTTLDYLCISVRHLWVYPSSIVGGRFEAKIQKIILETNDEKAYVLVSSISDEHWFERGKTLVAFLNRLQILDQNAGSIFFASIFMKYDSKLESMEICSRLNRYMEEMLPEEIQVLCTRCVL